MVFQVNGSGNICAAHTFIDQAIIDDSNTCCPLSGHTMIEDIHSLYDSIRSDSSEQSGISISIFNGQIKDIISLTIKGSLIWIGSRSDCL